MLNTVRNEIKKQKNKLKERYKLSANIPKEQKENLKITID